MVKLAYNLQGKGKFRKRTLDEVLSIIEDKTAYFKKIEANKTDSSKKNIFEKIDE
jgi:hypothetical protein